MGREGRGSEGVEGGGWGTSIAIFTWEPLLAWGGRRSQRENKQQDPKC